MNLTFVRDIVMKRIKSPTYDSLAKIADVLEAPVAALYTPEDQFEWAQSVTGMTLDFTESERRAVSAFIELLKQQRD